MGKYLRLKQIILLFLLSYLVTQCNKAFCHEIRPAYLEINQSDSITYSIIWKIPMTAGRVNSIQPVFPQGFTMNLVKEKKHVNSLSQLYEGHFSSSLIGKMIKIENLERTLIDVFTRINLDDGMTHSFLIQADKPYCLIPAQPNNFEIINSYSRLGIEHILKGYDHLLFVLSLLLLISSFSTLLWTVTCFTIAHSITLALASLDLMSLPSAPVEAVIALSIIFLAKEYLDVQRGKSSITADYPWVISFGFGLLHGFGFAGALQDIGFPQQQLFSALLSFNIGVELGQVIFILVCLAVYLLCGKLLGLSLRQRSKTILSYGIGSLATFWLIQRILIIL